MNSKYCFGIIVMLTGVPQAQLMYGTITDAVTGKPIPGATISLIEISKTCTTDSAGNYSTGLVPPGIFNATIAAPDHLMAFKKVIVASPKGTGISTIQFYARLYHSSSAADTSKGAMSLTYRFPGQYDVEIAIKNGIGKTIRKMYDRSRAGGLRTVSWNGKDDDGNSVPAGRYMYKISSGTFVIIRTLDWKGDPPKTAVVPAKAMEVLPKGEEPPAIPAPDTTTPEVPEE
jgi:hypothetical protein